MKRLLLLFIIFIGLVDVSNADAKNLLVDSTHKGNEVKISSSDTIHHFLKVMGYLQFENSDFFIDLAGEHFNLEDFKEMFKIYIATFSKEFIIKYKREIKILIGILLADNNINNICEIKEMGISFNQNIDNAYVTYSIFGPSYEILASVSGSSTRDIYNMFDSVESWYDDFKLKLSCKFDPIVTQSREQHFTMLFDQLKETCIKN